MQRRAGPAARPCSLCRSPDRNNAGRSGGGRPNPGRMRAVRTSVVRGASRHENAGPIEHRRDPGGRPDRRARRPPTPGRADEKPPPTVETASLRDLDVSHDIPPVAPPGRGDAEAAVGSRVRPARQRLVVRPAERPGRPARQRRRPQRQEQGRRADPALRRLAQPVREPLEDVLRAGADPNLPDKHGDTPLGRAIWGGHEKTVALLLKYGADPNGKRQGRGHEPGLRPVARGTRRSSPCWRRSGPDPVKPDADPAAGGPPPARPGVRVRPVPGGRRRAGAGLHRRRQATDRGGRAGRHPVLRRPDRRAAERDRRPRVRGAGAGPDPEVRPSWSRPATTGRRASGTPTRRGS